MTDKSPIDTFKRASWLMVFLLAFFSQTTPAFACLILPENREAEFDYDYLSNAFIFENDILLVDHGTLAVRNSAKSDLARKADFSDRILLVYPRKVPTTAKLDNYGKTDLVTVKLDVAEELKGSAPQDLFFSHDGLSLLAVPDPEKYQGLLKNEYKAFTKRTKQRYAAHDEFEFWDTQLFANSVMPVPGAATSCGVPTTPQFLFDSPYLYFGDLGQNGDNVIVPVSGKTDPLVEAVRKWLSDQLPLKRTIHSEEYFKNMTYVNSIILKQCPSGVKKSRTGWWDPFSNYPMKNWEENQNIKPFESDPVHPADSRFLDHLNHEWPGLFVYFPDSEKGGITCKGNERFLAFGYKSVFDGQPVLTDFELDQFTQSASTIRFAKVVDDEVIVASIKTQFALEGPERIPLDTVLSWIPETNFDPLKFPDFDE